MRHLRRLAHPRAHRLGRLAAVACVFLAACSSSGSTRSTAASSGPGSSGGSAARSAAPAVTVAAGVCWSAPVASPGAADGPITLGDATDSFGLTAPLAGMMGHAVAVGDVNGDGRTDLFVGGFADRPADQYALRGATGPAPDRLLLGTANGFAVDDGFPATMGRTSSAAFVDLNGDGRPDLVVARNNEQPGGKKKVSDIQAAPTTLYRNDGDGRFTALGAIGPQFSARAVTALDVDNDGKLDLFIGQDGKNGEVALLHNDGDFKFSDITARSGLPSTLIAFGVAAVDLNGDGKVDLAVAGDDKIFIGEGGGHFHDATPADFAWRTFGNEDLVTGVAVGDLNDDGRPDLVVGHHFGSALNGQHVPVRVFLNEGNDAHGDPSWHDVTAAAGVPGFTTKAPHVEIADFDNDGRPDLLVTASAGAGSVPVILRNTGASGDGVPHFRAPDGLGDPQYWVSGAVADFDHDGRLDVFVAEWYPVKPSLLLRTTGPSWHWLAVDLGATALGGIGSRIDVFEPGRAGQADALVGSGWVTGSTGYGAGAAPVVHVGLADRTAVDVVVTDPQGGTTTMAGVAADQLVRPGGC